MTDMWFDKVPYTYRQTCRLYELGSDGITNKVTKCLRSAGAVVRVIAAGRTSGKGWPDRYISHVFLPGGVWCEIKVGGGTLSHSQKERLSMLTDNNTAACVAWFTDNDCARGSYRYAIAGPVTCAFGMCDGLGILVGKALLADIQTAVYTAKLRALLTADVHAYIRRVT